MKKNIAKILVIIALIIVCIGAKVYADYIMNATEVEYTKSDSTKVSVKTALDDLYNLALSSSSSNFTRIASGYTSGKIVTFDNEEFYVLNDLGNGIVELFAKNKLNSSATLQENAGNNATTCEFSSSQYWSGTSENLNNVIGYNSSDVMGKVDTYAQTKGAISGRLLTYEEANELKSSYSAMVNATLNYWLGSSYSSESSEIWAYVSPYVDIGHVTYSETSTYGIRPVITVYKTDLSPIYEIGQAVTYGNEEFYVLNDLGQSLEIFAKTNLNSAATAQVKQGYSRTACVFSSNRYWQGYTDNINNVTGYKSTDVMGKVDTYVAEKGAISGRLLTYEEANSLASNYPEILWGYGNTAQSSNGHGYECYWLGTTGGDYNSSYVYSVDGYYIKIQNGTRYSESKRYGVRPVITVYKSQVIT